MSVAVNWKHSETLGLEYERVADEATRTTTDLGRRSMRRGPPSKRSWSSAKRKQPVRISPPVAQFGTGASANRLHEGIAFISSRASRESPRSTWSNDDRRRRMDPDTCLLGKKGVVHQPIESGNHQRNGYFDFKGTKKVVMLQGQLSKNLLSIEKGKKGLMAKV